MSFVEEKVLRQHLTRTSIGC